MRSINISKVAPLEQRVTTDRLPLMDAIIADISLKMEDADFVSEHAVVHGTGGVVIHFIFKVTEKFPIEDLASLHHDESEYIVLKLTETFTSETSVVRFQRYPFRMDENGFAMRVYMAD